MQKIATTGNATIIVYDGTPLLATDPWIGDEEPAYFGSWVLSHRIPQNLKDDIAACGYIWFSHGHPDHLNPTSIERFRGKKILLADHVGSRIHKDIAPNGFDVTILPDRKWVTLTDNVKVHCITTRIQDSILLVDVGGKLFINLNDAGTRDCSRYIRSITKHYKDSYVLALSGYGDADMINIYDEQGAFVLPRAARQSLQVDRRAGLHPLLLVPPVPARGFDLYPGLHHAVRGLPAGPGAGRRAHPTLLLGRLPHRQYRNPATRGAGGDAAPVDRVRRQLVRPARGQGR